MGIYNKAMNESSYQRLKDENSQLRNERNYFKTINQSQTKELRQLRKQVKNQPKIKDLQNKLQESKKREAYMLTHIHSIENAYHLSEIQNRWYRDWFTHHAYWTEHHNKKIKWKIR